MKALKWLTLNLAFAAGFAIRLDELENILTMPGLYFHQVLNAAGLVTLLAVTVKFWISISAILGLVALVRWLLKGEE